MIFPLFPNTYHQSCLQMTPICFILTRVKIVFKNANDELGKNSQWFKVNKLSLNEGKTKFTLFDKPRDNDNLSLQLPNLRINNYK